MAHVILLGDSVFDNAHYVGDGPDVLACVRDRLPASWEATLLAVDGSTTRDVASRLDQLPDGATHIVVSAGGNDALSHIDTLYEAADSMAGALYRLALLEEAFEQDYLAMLEGIRRRGLPMAVCTVYNPRFPDRELQRLAMTALKVFNDTILRAAFAAGVPVLDARFICDEDADFANPIEPSSAGSAKLADAIVGVLTGHDFARSRTEVYTR